MSKKQLRELLDEITYNMDFLESRIAIGKDIETSKDKLAAYREVLDLIYNIIN